MDTFIEILKRKRADYEVDGATIRVGGSLYLSGTQITALPDNLSVGGHLALDAEKISNVAFKKKCGRHNRTIFVAWVNGTFCISAGCFLGDYEKFCGAMDESYSGAAAAKYKADAKECIESLARKLNKGEAA